MTRKSVILLILAVYISAFGLHAWHLKKTVYGDGVFYYSWLRSLIVDRDINFTDEYRYASVSQPMVTDAKPGNKYSIGPALFWAPPYQAIHTALRGDGWTFLYQITAGVTSLAAALSGIILLTRILRFPEAVVSITILLIAGASNLLFYGAIDPVNSHALSFFCAVVFLALLNTPRKHWGAIGLVLALTASVRLQDMVYVLALFPHRHRIRWRDILLGFGIGFLPQLAAWFALYGTLSNPYLAGGEGFDLLHPHIWGVLFGIDSGLFLWTPIVAVGIYGLIMKGRAYWIYLMIVALQLYFVASWSTWWQGASVSGRMFVSTLPIVALGIAEVVTALYAHRLLRSILPHIALSLCVVNAMGIVYYLVTH
jgi:hypothetical protein